MRRFDTNSGERFASTWRRAGERCRSIGGRREEPRKIARYLAAECASASGCGADVLFGGGSAEHIRHAAAGRLADSGIVARHPELFGPGGIPQSAGGQLYWDPKGLWLGTCLSTFGICFNRDMLARLDVPVPASWEALADPRLHGQVALADPSKSGSVGKTFETIIQAQMQDGNVEDGWGRAIRLIRRIGGNARYFTEASAKVPVEVAMGDAAAGLCIDFYGRFQSEATATAAGGPGRVGFASAKGETALDPDPISLLRGAPHRDLASPSWSSSFRPTARRSGRTAMGRPVGPTATRCAGCPFSPRSTRRS